ncbi:hypothetical protein FRB96_003010 [Tulasnella sp. 330]|nr:hypothetical protein FRB96_003010 [Tulasnella sp. 330]KAG8883725.1 hypothetical protein FRB97_006036 [Tulasnella sp. 331]KAG8889040.1 hypothetical protein FRB98_005937 [Tulasnella sp. 332]
MHSRITRGLRVPLRSCRFNSSAASVYADKLKLKLKEEGVATIEELKSKLKKEGKLPASTPISAAQRPLTAQEGKQAAYRPPVERERKDSSPVKPLDSFFNVAAIMNKPHTLEQITALWTVYHASRSSGTGRGYVSAAVPIASYEAMMERARNYPMFVLPLTRPKDDSIPSLGDGSVTEDPAEFYFLQWGLHSAPPIPQSVPKDDPFPLPRPASYTDGSGQRNPPTSTVLFTPLVQYKLHQSYAPPYFAITHYTDFARTHGIVLLQGIITPTSSAAVSATGGAADGKYMLTQLDAQMLALGLQQFYLPREGEGELANRSQEAADLLHKFHHKPDEFEWESLLKFRTGLLS